MKHILHALFFFVGAALGVWWGVYHPAQATRIAAHEQKAIAEAKIAMIHQIHPELSTTAPAPAGDEKYQAALVQSQKDLDEANQQLGTP